MKPIAPIELLLAAALAGTHPSSTDKPSKTGEPSLSIVAHDLSSAEGLNRPQIIVSLCREFRALRIYMAAPDVHKAMIARQSTGCVT
jgi:hypothetical protein